LGPDSPDISVIRACYAEQVFFRKRLIHKQICDFGRQTSRAAGKTPCIFLLEQEKSRRLLRRPVRRTWSGCAPRMVCDNGWIVDTIGRAPIFDGRM
jgi:hypothetical protein